MGNAGNLRSRISISNLVNKGRALLDQVRQLWQEKLILPNGDINGRKMSWCLVVTSAIFCLISMLLIIVIGFSRTQNSVCHRSSASSVINFPTLDDSSRGAYTEICPEKRGFLRGEPCRGDCGGTRGCRTETAALCRMKCFDNLNCEAWTFHVSQQHCLLRQGGPVTTSFSWNSVWGLPCRVSDCQDTATSLFSWDNIGSSSVVSASEFYVGTTSTTKSGKKCRNWSKVRGQEHVGNHNHCRNPNSQWEGVGCFTDDRSSESCNVPKCKITNWVWSV